MAVLQERLTAMWVLIATVGNTDLMTADDVQVAEELRLPDILYQRKG